MNQELTNPTHRAQPLALSTKRAERIGRYLTASKANETRRKYRSQWAAFEAFCAGHLDDNDNPQPYSPLPAQPETVADYITHLADLGRKASSIQQALAAIGFVHETAEHSNPAKSPKAKATMQGIRRKVGIKATPKTALTPAELAQMVTTQPDDLRGIRNRALLLMGFAGAFRRSELVNLMVNDVTIRRETGGDVMSIQIQRSKTDQEGEGLYKTIEALSNPTLCPVTAWRAWLRASSIKSGPAFRGIDRWGNLKTDKMDGREVARIVQGAATAAGLDAAQFAGHSLRSGFVTAAAIAGVNDSDVMEQTGHKSSATLRRYKQMAGRGARRAMRAVFSED